ncbi:unnamed protein product [Protopolystoma xenopodis]|uniref:Uncharacterized protein n=1 Tax=Protopolystoma xenopodis TaxID=117903 RepID=A0A3S5A0X7_9PLAT|nr:unnamed protein product [Protopolystoma xenopodis]
MAQGGGIVDLKVALSLADQALRMDFSSGVTNNSSTAKSVSDLFSFHDSLSWLVVRLASVQLKYRSLPTEPPAGDSCSSVSVEIFFSLSIHIFSLFIHPLIWVKDYFV